MDGRSTRSASIAYVLPGTRAERGHVSYATMLVAAVRTRPRLASDATRTCQHDRVQKPAVSERAAKTAIPHSMCERSMLVSSHGDASPRPFVLILLLHLRGALPRLQARVEDHAHLREGGVEGIGLLVLLFRLVYRPSNKQVGDLFRREGID